MIRVAIITASDKGYAGRRTDLSGKGLFEYFCVKEGYKAVLYKMLPDEKEMLKDEMKEICDNGLADLIITTGGTGFSERDITPEATKEICDKDCPGIPEAMRFMSMQVTKRAMLTRSYAGIRGKTLIINFPGSKKACDECLEFIIDELKHGIEIMLGIAGECGRK